MIKLGKKEKEKRETPGELELVTNFDHFRHSSIRSRTFSEPTTMWACIAIKNTSELRIQAHLTQAYNTHTYRHTQYM